VKRVLRKILLLAVLATITLAATEGIARLVLPRFADDEAYLDRALDRLLNSAIRFDPNGENYSRKFGFTLTPNAHSTQKTSEYTYASKTNSLGFRSVEVGPRRGGEYRVMLLGDSFFWGVGVDESKTIAAALNRAGAPRLSVHNLSVVGYNTVQELIVARSYVDVVRPDHIVLGFFVGNDMVSNAMTFVDDNGNFAASDAMEAKVKRELRERMGVLFHSVIYRIVALDVHVPRIRYQIATSDEVIGKSYALLADLDALAKRAGARFSVVVLYPRDGVDGGMVEAWSGSRRAGALIAAFCRSHGIEVLDVLRYMNTPEQEERYFFRQDGHPNDEGNAIIAKAIFDEFLQQRIGP